MTFIKACEHISNYSAAHESRVSKLGDDRIDYPLYHIEADNRLSWFLGRLDNKYRDDAVYIHLTRDTKKIADSYNRRWTHPRTIVRAFANSILMSEELSVNPCIDYVRTVSENITYFLRDKTQIFHINIDEPEESFSEFWNYINAEGDLDLALREFKTLHNPSLVTSETQHLAAGNPRDIAIDSLERVINLGHEERKQVYALLSQKEKAFKERNEKAIQNENTIAQQLARLSELQHKLSEHQKKLDYYTHRSDQLESKRIKTEDQYNHLHKIFTELEVQNSIILKDYNKLTSRHNEFMVRVNELENSMSYRLGHAVIRNIKSPLTWFKVPFAFLKALKAKQQAPLALIEPKAELIKANLKNLKKRAVEAPNRVLYKSAVMAQESFEEAEEFMNLHGTPQDKLSFNIIKANNCLDLSLSETRWLHYINNYLSKYEITPLSLTQTEGDLFSRLTCDIDYKINDDVLVSIIMPAFNSEKTLRHSAESILNQTWNNIQLIIVDDCSDDNTWKEIERLKEKDARVIGLRNGVNVGPYVSKNKALKYVKGTYFTGQDADDWSHPQRIERQLASLRLHKNLKALVSYMIRITSDGKANQLKPIGRLSFDGVAVLSPISCMFETEFFFDNLGCWDAVRFAGDSELLGRMKSLLKGNLFEHEFITLICQDLEGSLTNNPSTGVRVEGHGLSPARKAYSNAYNQWHQELNTNSNMADCKLELIGEHRPFDAPNDMLVPKSDLLKVYDL